MSPTLTTRTVSSSSWDRRLDSSAASDVIDIGPPAAARPQCRTRGGHFGPGRAKGHGYDDRIVLHLLDLRGRPDPARALAAPADVGAGADDAARVGARHHRRRPRPGRRRAARADRPLRRLRIDDLQVPPPEIQAAFDAASPDLRAALDVAATRIRDYHAGAGRVDHAEIDADGISVRELTLPVGRAGCYVPGGRAAYPSTVLMTAIPARVAGVPEVVLCVPPGADGSVPSPRSRPRPSPGSTRCTGSAARRRSRPWPTAPRPSPRST